MLVVPLSKDTIRTKDGVIYKVIEYTNFKEIGPAVYAKLKGNKQLSIVYFADIDMINKTKVEYQRGSKVFLALGNLDRKYQLPQPDDNVIFGSTYSHGLGKDRVDVVSLKLKSKSLGNNKGLFIKDSDGEYHRLKHILDIEPSIINTTQFNLEEYLDYYKDYIGV